jgi:hypothetical protein
MGDETVDMNNRVKATMRQVETPLNTSGTAGAKVRSPCTTTGNTSGKGRGPLNTSTNPNR